MLIFRYVVVPSKNELRGFVSNGSAANAVTIAMLVDILARFPVAPLRFDQTVSGGIAPESAAALALIRDLLVGGTGHAL